jgi:hypothetical protein
MKMTTHVKDSSSPLSQLLALSLILCLAILSNPTAAQAATDDKIIFLHHSTGAGVWSGGAGVSAWFSSYNSTHGTSYDISERSYPTNGYPWENYPYDYWNLWINGACNSSVPAMACLPKLTSDYDVVIYKHCFPGAGVIADDGNPSVSSDVKTLANYKLQYRALRQLMDGYTDNKFIVWTLAPLHRNATDADQAARAGEFVNWVKTDYLTEDGNSHPNIFIFDFFGLVAGTDNFLKYEYEGSHDGDDSHPNSTANAYVSPLFSQFIVDTADCSYKDARIGGDTPVYYDTPKDAYDHCAEGGTVQLHTSSFDGPLTLDNPAALTLEGGLGCDYSFNQGYSSITGPVTITGGAVTIERIIIR